MSSSSYSSSWKHSDYIFPDFLMFTLPCLGCAIISVVLLCVALARRWRRSIVITLTATSLSSCCLTFAFPADFGLYSLPIAVCLIVMTCLILTTFVYFILNRRNIKKSTQPIITTFCQEYSLELILFAIAFFSMLAGLLVILLLRGICIGTQPVSFSTTQSRTQEMTSICKDDEECYSYFTLDEDTTTITVTSHFQQGPMMDPQRQSFVCQFAVIDKQTLFEQTIPATIRTKALEDDIDRLILFGTISNLTEMSLYSVQPVCRGNGVVLRGRVLLLRSLPQKSQSSAAPANSSSIPFLVGGDIYSGDRGWNMLRTAMKFSPKAYFAVIGGDLVYDNNLPTCYRRWDDFFVHWQALMIREDGASLPLLTTIGNHEGGGYLKDDHVHFYIDYFQYKSLGGIPTAHAHIIGDSIGIVALDSGVSSSVSSQNAILESTLSNWAANKRMTFAAYHVPAFPSYRSYTDPISQLVRENWPPIFERTNLSLALEHHDHMYKRTYPISKLSKVPAGSTTRGVVYVGDGSIGVYDGSRGDDTRWYLDKKISSDYMLEVVVFPSNRTMSTVKQWMGNQL
eukprot:PhF_6_TR5219/c0_g1_i1/m.7531